MLRLVAAFTFISITHSYGAYLVKQTVKGGVTSVESVEHIDKDINQKILLKDIRESIAEKVSTENIQYQEWLVPDSKISKDLKLRALKKQKKMNVAGSEVREIIKQGDDNNRIVLTILGDGYTLAEKEKYFQDVDRMVNDLFREVTFKSYLPLFNIYAVFVPSRDSGITDIQKKNTAFGLFRSPRGSKRGIMPGDRGAIERALKLSSDKVDYPIIIANDDYYGGLGGRYAITTRSLNSGSMVLRHELGHNFSNVGEEYDGGQVYSGANFSSSTRVDWMHWVNGELQVNKAKFLTGAYVWKDLTEGDFVDSFNFPSSEGHNFSMKISSVGWSGPEDVKVTLDGQELELNGVFTRDRSFFQTTRSALGHGSHEIRVQDHSHDGDNVLAFANAYAYPNSYNFKHGVVGAFNVFGASGEQRGYRPTDNQCLMRDMRSKVFCPIDQENIWLRFFRVVDLIDRVEVSDEVEVKTLNLPKLETRWFKRSFWGEGDEIAELRGKTKVNLPKGKYLVKVEFKTSEIRKEKVIDTKKFEVN
ncbi:MAG: hypothetical protein KC478_11935 [Bacteriovoracaceae bacterium]|nr:hypothetical protein [Bacteriovoracaceae bacterium]